MKRKFLKRTVKILTIIFCAAALLLIVFHDNIKDSDFGQKYLFATIGDIKINAFALEGKQYLFLPSYAEDEDIVLSSALKRSESLTICKSSDIPAVFITTVSGNLDRIYEDRNNKESGKVSVINSDGTVNFSGKMKYIKGRGNYSWDNWDKKPFGICFGSKTSILGLGSGYKYALIANASDATLIRNDVARDLEAEIGLEHSHVGCFVDLYINGDYMGNYYLIDSLEVGNDRIDIFDLETDMEKLLRGTKPSEFPVYETSLLKGWNLPEFSEDISGGYLIEREFAGRYTVDYEKNPSCFTTSYDEHFIVKSPQYCSKEQINYICDYVSDAEDAIRNADESDETYLEYIDLDSMSRKYLVEEFTKNYDAGVSSSYFYKDIDSVDSRLHAAPGWDYDMSLGNYLDWMDFKQSGTYGYIHDTNNTDASVWWEELFDKDAFAEKTVDLYNNVLRPYVINSEMTRIDSLAETLKASAQMDYIRWKAMYDSLGYMPGSDSEYDRLKKFMADRIRFLDGK